LEEWPCASKPAAGWDRQIAGCTKAIGSGKLAGKELLSVRRGTDTARGDLERATGDYGQASSSYRMIPTCSSSVASDTYVLESRIVVQRHRSMAGRH
jgi:hypothetical protein